MPVSKSINTPFFLLLLLFILSIQGMIPLSSTISFLIFNFFDYWSPHYYTAQPSRTAFVTPTNVFTPSSPLSSFTCGASLTRWDYPSLSLLFPFVGGWNRIRSDSPDCGVCLLLSNNNFNNYNNSNNSSDSANNSTSNNYNHNNHTIFLTFVHDANPPPPNTSGDHFIIPNDAFKILFDNFGILLMIIFKY